MANYPSSVSTNANLYIAVNGLQTTLASSITNSQTTITLTSTSGFPTTGLVTIENNEVVSYTGISGADLTGCTRGADGTTALAHATGVTVGATVVAAHHNLLKDEVIAIETALGANLVNVFPATPTTGTGNVVLQTSPTINTPILTAPDLGTPTALVLTNATGTPASIGLANGTGLPLTTGVTGVLPNANTTATPNATASTIMSRDASINSRINEMIENFTSTATAAGTTILTVTSSPIQQFTGTTTQTVRLPDATTLVVGHYFTVLNRSTGVVTVTDNSTATVQALNAGAQTTFVLTNNGSAAGVWDASTSSGSGSVAQYNTFIVGTASGTYTGSLTVVDLSFAYVQDGKTLNFYYNGQQLTPAVDYTETSSTSITLTSAMVVGARIMARSNASSSTATAVTFYREDYIVGTASGSYTGSLTVFNLTNTYTPGGTNLKVYLDGDLQTVGGSVDYVETSSSIVTFNNALVATQKVSFIFSQSVAPAGTVSSGTANQVAYYPSTGSTIAGSSNLSVSGGSATLNSNSASNAEVTLTTTAFSAKLDATNGGNVELRDLTNSVVAAFYSSSNHSFASKGTNTNDSQSAGYVGEVISATLVNLNAAATTTYADATSISLTAGEWEVSVNGNWLSQDTASQTLEIGVSVNSGNNGATLNVEAGNRQIIVDALANNGRYPIVIPSYRVQIASTTTHYLKYRAIFAATAPQLTAIILARRVR